MEKPKFPPGERRSLRAHSRESKAGGSGETLPGYSDGIARLIPAHGKARELLGSREKLGIRRVGSLGSTGSGGKLRHEAGRECRKEFWDPRPWKSCSGIGKAGMGISRTAGIPQRRSVGKAGEAEFQVSSTFAGIPGINQPGMAPNPPGNSPKPPGIPKKLGIPSVAASFPARMQRIPPDLSLPGFRE